MKNSRLKKDLRFEDLRISVDTGMIMVIFISMMYLAIVFILLFYVDNEWCDLLHKNMTVREGFFTTTDPHPPVVNFPQVLPLFMGVASKFSDMYCGF